MPKTLTVQQFVNEVNDGEFFSVEFIKRTNGEFRQMTARRGVSKGVKNDSGTNGSWNRVNQDKEHGVLTCYDVNKVVDHDNLEENPKNKGAFRRIPLDGLLRAKAHGIRYEFDKNRNIFVESENQDD